MKMKMMVKEQFLRIFLSTGKFRKHFLVIWKRIFCSEERVIFSKEPDLFVAACPMLITHAHVQQSQKLQQQSSSQRVGALSLIPSCLGISGHPSGSRQGHPRYTGERSAGRPWAARTQFSTAVQCRNTANMVAEHWQQEHWRQESVVF